MAMMVGACSDRFRAIFSLGPVAAANQYGGEYVYCDINNEKEIELAPRSFGWIASKARCTFLRVLETEIGTPSKSWLIQTQIRTSNFSKYPIMITLA